MVSEAELLADGHTVMAYLHKSDAHLSNHRMSSSFNQLQIIQATAALQMSLGEQW